MSEGQPPIYKHRRLPALGVVAEQQTVDEFRRLEVWGEQINARTYQLEQDLAGHIGRTDNPHATSHPDVLNRDTVDSHPTSAITGLDTALAARPISGGCTQLGLIYWSNCDPLTLNTLPASYDSVTPSVDWSCHHVMDFDRGLICKDSAGEGAAGVGVIAGPSNDVFIAVGTSDIDQWTDPYTRRPAAYGGSDVLLDAGASMRWRLPAVYANTYGYTLQLASDGETVIAAENSPPGVFETDTSTDDGTLLSNGDTPTGWYDFPADAAATADKLIVTIPSGTKAGLARIQEQVFVTNTSTRTGTVTIGVGIDGANPVAEDQAAYPIAAGFSGAISFGSIITMDADLTADLTLTVMLNVTGDHIQFALETDSTLGTHSLEASVSYGGSGAAQQPEGQGGIYTTALTDVGPFTANTKLFLVSGTPILLPGGDGTVTAGAPNGMIQIAAGNSPTRVRVRATLSFMLATSPPTPLFFKANIYAGHSDSNISGDVEVLPSDSSTGGFGAFTVTLFALDMPLVETPWYRIQLEASDAYDTLRIRGFQFLLDYD